MKEALALLLVAAFGAVAYWPYHVSGAFLAALAAEDEAAVAERVDFSALKAHLNARLHEAEARADAAAAGVPGDPPNSGVLQSLVGGLARAMGERLIELFVSPGSLIAFTRLGEEDPGARLAAARRRWVDPSHFEVEVGQGEEALTFVFERRGLTWKVVDLRFDPEGLRKRLALH
ncbi:MAG: DUF2939 domain-containing protein [Deltaproteobacteria bacterium]|nr:MAG: DUF2939 domain-containing protein [Deltaproteobacteria bacterium]